jgi:hypothetical protein
MWASADFFHDLLKLKNIFFLNFSKCGSTGARVLQILTYIGHLIYGYQEGEG